MRIGLLIFLLGVLPSVGQTRSPARPPGALLAPWLAESGGDGPEIVFVARPPQADGHWYENFGGTDAARVFWYDGARLCRLNLRTGALRVLLADERGGIRDPHGHYDGHKILFSYRKGGTEHYRLHEINIDGTGLRAITSEVGIHDDIEPIYLPDGGIVFVSSRVKRQVPCWSTEVGILHRASADGSDIRPISANMEHENTPCVLPDGRLCFMRWEYIDRHEGAYHHLWTMNPDGTGVAALYGNGWAGGVYLDAQSVPGTSKILFVDAPGHGTSDHQGWLTLLDPKAGPDARAAARRIPAATADGRKGAPKDAKGSGLWGRDPYPVSSDLFLYADGEGIHLANLAGQTELLHAILADQAKAMQFGGKAKGKELPVICHEPRLLRPRPREPVIPSRVDWSQTTGTLVLADVLHGRNMTGVAPGEVKRIQVFEVLPKPCDSNDVNLSNPDRTYRFLKRNLGEFPVEPDGSAHVQVPALRALEFVALDEKNLSVKHKLSFVSVMPGETISCAGCHEHRTQTTRAAALPLALQRPPSVLVPIEGVPPIIDFPRDVQPVLDRHCVRCHNANDLAGRMDLSGERGTWRSYGFINLVRDGRASLNFGSAGNRPPHSLGSGASPILKTFSPAHYEVKISPAEIRLVQTWLDGGVTYRGAYIATPHEASVGKAMDLVAARCIQCHRKEAPGKSAAKPQFSLPRFTDARLRIEPKSLIFNITRPERSLALRAPLAKDAGGLGWCKTTQGGPVFGNTDDPDYKLLLAEIKKGQESLRKADAHSLGGNALAKFRLYGLLPATFDPRKDKLPADLFDLEQRYFQMTYGQPEK